LAGPPLGLRTDPAGTGRHLNNQKDSFRWPARI
jgi:hypothetical protein